MLGSTVRIDGQLVELVGILDRAFVPPEAIAGAKVDLWLPLLLQGKGSESHGLRVLKIAAQLSASATPEQFEAQAQAVVRLLDTESEGHYRDREGALLRVPVRSIGEVTVREVRAGLHLLLGAVGLLLLIACFNVAHLSLTQGLSRMSEMKIRVALGASRAAMLRQLLSESALIAGLGGLLGSGLAVLGVQGFLGLYPEALPRGESLTLDVRVAAFVVVLSVLTILVFGLAPALRTAGGALAGLGSRSQSVDRGSSTLRSGLVVLEVALSLVLLICAALLIRSFDTVSSAKRRHRYRSGLAS